MTVCWAAARGRWRIAIWRGSWAGCCTRTDKGTNETHVRKTKSRDQAPGKPPAIHARLGCLGDCRRATLSDSWCTFLRAAESRFAIASQDGQATKRDERPDEAAKGSRRLLCATGKRRIGRARQVHQVGNRSAQL